MEIRWVEKLPSVSIHLRCSLVSLTTFFGFSGSYILIASRNGCFNISDVRRGLAICPM